LLAVLLLERAVPFRRHDRNRVLIVVSRRTAVVPIDVRGVCAFRSHHVVVPFPAAAVKLPLPFTPTRKNPSVDVLNFEMY
jgi:hypothetical protein